MQTSFARYLVLFGGVLAGGVIAVWLYVALAPMAYLEGGYPAWVAKSRMLQECRLGQVAFFGDSRLEGGVIPALLPVEASNFGLAAGTAVETRSAVARAMACATPPGQAVISLSPEHFGPLSRFFWILSLRYGFVSPGELLATERLASALGDTQSLATHTPDGLSGPVRDWMYAARFPSLAFSNLVQARLFGRYAINQARLAAVLQARGWSEYQPQGGGAEPRPPFVETKLQSAELEAALRLLQARGVETRLLIMPSVPSDPALEAAYLAYLHGVVARFPGVTLIGGGIPHWPARLFADGAHLTGAGAKLFSERLAACMVQGRLQTECDLEWRADTVAR